MLYHPAQITYCDFICRGVGLDAKDFTGKSDPYIVIKCPTKLAVRRNIFEYEINMSANGEDYTSNPSSLKSSQGSVICEDTEADSAHMLSSVAMSSVHAGAHHVKKAHPQTDGFKEVFESEVVKGSLDPQWNPFRIGFYEMCRGNTTVELLIECYDWDRFKPSDFIGSVRVSMQVLLDAKVDLFQLVNRRGEPSGKLFLKCKSSEMDLVYCDFKASGVDIVAKHSNGSSDPFFVIKAPISTLEPKNAFSEDSAPSKLTKIRSSLLNLAPTEEYRVIYESPVVKGNLNPNWGIFQLGYYDMCKGNLDAKLLIECYDHKDLRRNRFIGSAEILVRDLVEKTTTHTVTLLSRKHKKESGAVLICCKPANPSKRKIEAGFKWRPAHAISGTSMA